MQQGISAVIDFVMQVIKKKLFSIFYSDYSCILLRQKIIISILLF